MARKVANYAKWTQDEWQEYRSKQHGIGGSDIAAVLGINQYKSKRRLWAELTGAVERQDLSDNQAVKMGHKLEPIVADLFAEETGFTVRRNNWILQHDTIDYLYANLDREVILPDGSRAVLECKTANARMAKYWQEDTIPREYMAQVQFYLMITGYKKAFIAVLIGGVDFDYWEIDRNENIIAELESAAADFWQLVETNTTPAPDGSKDAAATLLESYSEAEENKTITLEHSDYEKIEIREILQKQKAELEKQILAIDNYFKDEIGKADAVSALVKDRYVSWNFQNRKKVDQKALKEAYPDLVEQYERAAGEYTAINRIRVIKY